MASLTHQARQEDRAQQVYDLICDCPGVGQSDIARGLGISVSQVKNSLIHMEKLGLAVSEDQRNRLYPFEYRGLNSP